jgi:DHA1 family tetracycline resistance protein-like MFS transporter
MPVLFLIVLIDLIGFGIIIPLLPFYGEHYGADPHDIGLLMAIYSLFQLTAAPLWGRLSDRIGRRPILLLGMAGSTVSYIWLGMADSLWMLFAARALGGAMAGNIAAAFAYAADITTPENRAKGMGFVGAAFGLGFIFGPAIGGILAGPDPAAANYQLPAFAAAAMSFIAMVSGLIALKESRSRAQRDADGASGNGEKMLSLIRRRPISLLILTSFMATFVFAGMEATFALWSERSLDWGPEQNGYLFSYVGILGAAIQGGAIGHLSRRLGEPRLIVAGTALLAIGIAGIPFVTNVATLAAVMAVVAVGFSILNPALNSQISRQVGSGSQGVLMGAARSATTLGRVLGPAWAGFLFSYAGKDWPFLAGAAVMILILPLAFVACRRS